MNFLKMIIEIEKNKDPINYIFYDLNYNVIIDEIVFCFYHTQFEMREINDLNIPNLSISENYISRKINELKRKQPI